MGTGRAHRCELCRHPHASHDAGLHCRTVIASNWDTDRGEFTRLTTCRCPTYIGAPPKPPDPNDCPHEYVDGDAACVLCSRTRVE